MSMPRLQTWSLFVLSLFVSAPAFAGNPWEELMGRKPTMWNDPKGRFSIDLPLGWELQPRTSGDNIVDFAKHDTDRGFSALLSIEMRPLPPNVRLAHFSSKVNDEVRKDVRGYKLLAEDRMTVAGVPAYRRHFSHQDRGHAELTRECVQVMFLVGERAFVVTLLTHYGARALFWEDFEIMMKGFNAQSPGEEIKPSEKRKKVRAGEMVNPDALDY